MDETTGPLRSPGGNVEPADRGFVAKDPRQSPSPPAERFELHDPRTDLTYRMKTYVDMVTKANQIGAIRFTAIGPDGSRSTVSKTAGVWRRDERTPIPPTRTSQQIQDLAATAPTPADKSSPTPVHTLRRLKIDAALHERYVIRRAPFQIGDVTIGQTEYRDRGDTSRIAFTESTFRISTDTNNPSVARSMVDVAEARGWQVLRVSGNEDFKRMVWLEASLRDVRTIGYEPAHGDHALLRTGRAAQQANRIDKSPPAAATSTTTPHAKQSERGSGGRKSVLAALEAVLIAKNVPEPQRDAVMAAAAENLAVRVRNGETHRVKIYDRSAPSHAQAVAPSRDVQRDRERGAPSR